MKRQSQDNSTRTAMDNMSDAYGNPLAEINALSLEIIDLYYDQIFSQSSINTPSAVCKAFSDILQRHWQLCCMVIYLRGSGGHLEEIAANSDEYLDEAGASRVGARMAAALESLGSEFQIWPDDETISDEPHITESRKALAEAGMRAGVAVPIYARGELAGAVIVVTPFSERLRASLVGLRFIAAPIMIAVGNARRTAAMREQHERIEHLIEESRARALELEEANRELRHVAHYRSLFLARMSHELRTPLTSILGFAEIMLDHESLTEQQRRFCEKIQSSGLQLQTSLTQLVDLSRLEAGQTEIFLHEFSLREALRESGAAVARLAQKQDVKVVCETSEEIVPTIVSDEGKLRQVFYNFLAHAINRSPAGGQIRVGVKHTSPSHFCVRIEDEGEPVEDLSRIFEPINIEAPTETAASMNELGLAIARRLIDILGGNVKLESNPPRGLRVFIELPLRPMKG